MMVFLRILALTFLSFSVVPYEDDE